MKIFRWILLTIGILIALFFLAMFQPWVFLPHKHIQMGLPFGPEDDVYTRLIPLGEKIEHPDGDGHPGLDFGWDKKTKILAVADGLIIRITKDKYGKYNIQQNMTYYQVEYKEMNEIEPGLHFLSKVKKGQLLGYSGYARTGDGRPEESDPSGQIHWDFASSSKLIDRLCPVNYFDAESKARLLKIWNDIPENDIFKKQYPEICNGIFKDKEDQ